MTNLELVAYCKGCLGLPYIYATYGNKLTLDVLNRSYRKYPRYWSATRYAIAKKNYIGKKVQDCTGLVEGFLMGSTPTTFAKYDGSVDRSANGWFNAAKEKGAITQIPEIVGLGVHKEGHEGIYIGNGKVIEARGFDYGVVETKLGVRGWTHWYEIPGITYLKEENATSSSDSNSSRTKILLAGARISMGGSNQVDELLNDYTAFVKEVQGCFGLNQDGIITAKLLKKTVTVSASTNRRHVVVRALQAYLNAIGYSCGRVDGIAGPLFTAALKSYQKEIVKASLRNQDGILTAGKATWKQILGYGA